MISALVITKNEARDILACLGCLAWCDEVIVVDAHSTDRTRQLASGAGARVFTRAWDGFSGQRNFGIEQCRGDWIFYLDADERVDDSFQREARAIEALGESALSGYWVNSLEYFMGDFLRHGGYGLHQANRKIRFWRNRPQHRFTGEVHERVTVTGATGRFTGHVEHFSSAATVSGMVRKLDAYSDLEHGDRVPHAAELVSRPLRTFASRYLRHQGFRDGTRGLVACQLAAIYQLLATAKQIERQLLAETPTLNVRSREGNRASTDG